MKIGSFFRDVLQSPLKNDRWSWGAQDPRRNRIYLRVWDDEITADRRSVQVFSEDWEARSPGQPERRQHLEAIRNGTEALAIVCQAAASKPGQPNKIKSFDSQELMRLSSLRQKGPEVWAQIAGHVSVQELAGVQSGQSGLRKDLEDIAKNPRLTPTEKEALVKARLGQGTFRTSVLSFWADACAVTGCTVPEALRASHIKPWRSADNTERLDSRNGLALVAHLDALFDVGLVTFDDSGSMLVSAEIPDLQRKLLGLSQRRLRRRPDSGTRAYLKYHRDNLYALRNAPTVHHARDVRDEVRVRR
jgi:putative restriction endonuclease